MSARMPVEITKDNDLTFEAGTIKGRDPADGVVKTFTGNQISGWIAAAAESDTALGAAKTFNAIATGKFVPFFQATEVNAALAAAGVLADGATLWCVLKADGDFRVAIELVYRTAREA